MKAQISTSIFIGVLGLIFYNLDFSLGLIGVELLLSIYIIFKDTSKGISNTTFLTFYSIFALTYIVGNYAVTKSIDTPSEIEYNYYLSKPHVLDGLMISFVGHLGIVLGYLLLENKFINFKMDAIIPDSILVPTLKFFSVYFAQTFVTGISIDILNYFAYPFLFLGVKSAIRTNSNQLMNNAIFLVFLISIQGLLYSYRRQAALEPFMIFFIALIIGLNSEWKKAFNLKYLIIGCFFVFLVSQFTSFGKVRALSGESRVQEWAAIYESEQEKEDDENFNTPIAEDVDKNSLARASTINQLSQVARIQDENGYYDGSTMSYLLFAFIPRAIWPEKPLIMQGRWFAFEAGLAYNHDSNNSLTGVNNSINMTVAGELFLNFGYWGLFIVMVLIGHMLKLIWNISNFYDVRNNLTGTILGIFLIMVAYFYLQVDMQFLVTLIQVLLTVLAFNFILNKTIAKSE